MKKILITAMLGLTACSSMPFNFTGFGGNKIAPTPPANQPPANYALNEFIDKRGCNYIKPGGGSSQWVPMVTISGSHICNGGRSNYNISKEVNDPHGTLVAAQNPTPAPQSNQVRVDGVGEGNALTRAFAGITDTFTGAISDINTTVAASSTVAETQAPQPQAVAPTPQVQQTAPQPQAVAPVRQAAPSYQLAVQTGVYRSNIKLIADEARLRQLGYTTIRKALGSDFILHVLPRAGESAGNTRSALLADGFKDAIVVGIVR